jgi:hypothetical protein
MAYEKTMPDSNSPASSVEVAEKATDIITPTSGLVLSERALEFFNDIISEKANADWTQHQITYAAMLARFMAELDINQEKAEEEGSLIRSGTKLIQNPRIKIITVMFDKINGTRRSLGIHALQGGKWIGKVRKRTDARLQEESEMAEALEDEELLA